MGRHLYDNIAAPEPEAETAEGMVKDKQGYTYKANGTAQGVWYQTR
jgi:hypothetical protein